MITEIWKDKHKLDLYPDTKIRFTLQVNDIAELKDRQASYTNSFNLPKTANNVQALDGLSIPSDTSNAPYLKPNCKLKNEGFDVIKKGWMNIKDTDDDYTVYLYSGLIDFFKAIENKTLGDIDITEINHTKDLVNVVKSYEPNSTFRYFLADYNGQTHFLSDQNIINIDYLVPSVNVKYLWDKLHDTFKFPYSGEIFNSEAFKSLWLTYSKAPNIAGLYKLITKGHNVQQLWFGFAGAESPVTKHKRLPVTNVDQGSTVWRNSQFLDIEEDGMYRIYFDAVSTNPEGNPMADTNYWLGINSEQIPIHLITNKILLATTRLEMVSSTRIIPLQAGTVLQLFFEKPFNGHPQYIDAHFTIRIQKIEKEDVNFNDSLGDMLVTDFVKEIINIHALTIFPKENSNLLKYKTISERIRTNNVVDWSDKFIERRGEEYVSTSFARRNYFQYQYNDKEGSHLDSSIDVNNMNITATKTIFKSKTYAPERSKTKFRINSTTEIDSDVFKFYDKQPADNPSNPPIYKGLEKRFYFIRQAEGLHSVTLGSDATNEEININNALVGNFVGLDWQNLIGNYYGEYSTILNDSRIHNIDLDLDIIDIIQLDFTALYYFKQEQQYYILNKINFEKEKAAGEFIRVKKAAEADPESLNIIITWKDGDINNTSTYDHYLANAIITGNPTYVWQTRFNNDAWIDAIADIDSYDYHFKFGINQLRVRYTNGLVSGFSNILSYERKIEKNPKRCYRFDFTSLQGLPRTIDFVSNIGLITQIVIDFSSPSEIKSIDAKAIVNMGGATLVNQTIIECPPIICRKYTSGLHACSGDQLTVNYLDCNGNTVEETLRGSDPCIWIETTVCAVEGTFTTNGNLTIGDLC